MANILVAGATGFIGRRLLSELLKQGHEVYALCRIKGIQVDTITNPRLHFIFGDMRDISALPPWPKKIDAAYYFLHSLGISEGDLLKTEEQTALHFLMMIEKTECRQIIYLGGIIEDEENLSPHLYSRLKVEKILANGSIPCTVLRSSIIIGAGSASFEIIRDLVENLPIMVAPKWVKSYCQPIAIQDVLFYLTAVLLKPECFNRVFDIGGPEAMTFGDVLKRYADYRHLKRRIFEVPVLTPKLSSYWLVFITSVRFSICSHLVESMKQNTRKVNLAIDAYLPHKTLTYEEALSQAFEKIVRNEVASTWMDSWNFNGLNADVEQLLQTPKEGCFKDVQIFPIVLPIDEVHRRIWSIGGDRGWYSLNWAWKLRGLIDQFVGGTGLNRGRRHPSKIEVGDSIDFWRVLLADEARHHLILYAEMKLPGEAWLEFEINEEKKLLKQTATFRPKGLKGRLYWYACLPFHWIIFRNMAKALTQDLSY